jgi:hypothetical protein
MPYLVNRSSVAFACVRAVINREKATRVSDEKLFEELQVWVANSLRIQTGPGTV